MKLYKCLMIAIFLIGSYAFGQSVTFYFVAPTASINSSFPGAGRTERMPTGYSFVEITSTNAATFLTAAPDRIKYVYNRLQPGNLLRTQVEKVFDNSGRIVDVLYFLVDDRTNLPAETTHMFLARNQGGHPHVWPAASGAGPLTNNRYLGWVMLGEYQLNSSLTTRPGGIKYLDEVVLHETSHTQFVGAWSKWPHISGMLPLTYGADGNHYFIRCELLGDQEGALNEGLGNFYGYTLNDDALNHMIRDFSDAGERYFVEGRSVLAGDQALTSVSTRRRDVLRTNEGIAHYPGGGDVTIYLYTWRDMPAFPMLFAEITSSAFYSLFWSHAYTNRDTAFSFISFASNAMFNDVHKRYLTYACNRLALKMEAYNNSPEGLADASKTSSMLPFAILDLVTHFGMTDAQYRADYDRHYPDRQPRAYAEYFTRRNAIRQLVQADLDATPIRFNEAMRKIKDYCRTPDTIF